MTLVLAPVTTELISYTIHTLQIALLLHDLGLPNACLDTVLLSLTLLQAHPPSRLGVVTLQKELSARSAGRMAFITLLSAHTAGEAAFCNDG